MLKRHTPLYIEGGGGWGGGRDGGPDGVRTGVPNGVPAIGVDGLPILVQSLLAGRTMRKTGPSSMH